MINPLNQNAYSAQSAINTKSQISQMPDTANNTNITSKHAQQLVTNILSASPTEFFSAVSTNKINVTQALSLVD